jgi:hypothetical protein
MFSKNMDNRNQAHLQLIWIINIRIYIRLVEALRRADHPSKESYQMSKI